MQVKIWIPCKKSDYFGLKSIQNQSRNDNTAPEHPMRCTPSAVLLDLIISQKSYGNAWNRPAKSISGSQLIVHPS